MSDDPFATESDTNDLNRVRVTLKAGTGYDAPWITVDGANVSDVLSQLNSLEVPDLLARTVAVAQEFHLGYKPRAATAEAAPSGPNPVPAASPSDLPEKKRLPAGTKFHPEAVCNHGWPKYWRQWTRASDNKTFKGWFCQSGDQANQCKPDFTN